MVRVQPVLLFESEFTLNYYSQNLHDMPDWTHLIRFIAVEDSLVHLGQLVDVTRDIGRDSVDGVEIAAYVIEGTIFDGKVTKDILHVKQVRRPTKTSLN
jgi:hypothetical protein